MLDHVSFDTFRVKDLAKGSYRFRCLDAVATSHIPKVRMDWTWIEWTDHALVVAEIEGLTAVKPEYGYDRKEIEETWKDPEVVKQLLNSAFPFTSAERLIADRLVKHP